MKTITQSSKEFTLAVKKSNQLAVQIDVIYSRLGDLVSLHFLNEDEKIEKESLQNACNKLLCVYNPLKEFVLAVIFFETRLTRDWNQETYTYSIKPMQVTDEQLKSLGLLVVENKVVTTEKSQLFKTAWELLKITGKSFAVCLAKAWNLFRLRKSLQTCDKVKFAFEKTDGSLRIAFGTLKNIQNLVKGTGKEIVSTMNYFDVEAKQFRSFKIENLITVYPQFS